MIERVQFQNFKALQDVSLDLSRLTVLVGPNGSGKTSVLEGMKYLDDAVCVDPENILPDSGVAVRLPTAPHDRPAVLSWQDNHGDLYVAFGSRGLEKGLASVIAQPNIKESHTVYQTAPDSPFVQIAVGKLRSWSVRTRRMGVGGLLRLDAVAIVAPSFDNRETPQMQNDGTGLPSVLAHLASAAPRVFDDILKALCEVVPTVRGLRFPRAPVKRTETEVITVDGKPFTHRAEKEYWGNSIEFDMENALGIPASMVSEGTLLVLGLLTVILGPGRPRLLLLDDIDRALHPKAQGDLVALLRRLLDKFPEMQIVATSHSPYLLDHLHPKEIRLTTLKADGTVAAGRLDEHPEFEKWRETMTPGEFWSMVGESWLVDVRAGDLPSGERS